MTFKLGCKNKHIKYHSNLWKWDMLCKISDKITLRRFISMSSLSHQEILWTKNEVNEGKKILFKKEDITSFNLIFAFSSILIYRWLWTLESVIFEVMEYYYCSLCLIIYKEVNEHIKQTLIKWDNAQVHK